MDDLIYSAFGGPPILNVAGGGLVLQHNNNPLFIGKDVDLSSTTTELMMTLADDDDNDLHNNNSSSIMDDFFSSSQHHQNDDGDDTTFTALFGKDGLTMMSSLPSDLFCSDAAADLMEEAIASSSSASSSSGMDSPDHPHQQQQPLLLDLVLPPLLTTTEDLTSSPLLPSASNSPSSYNSSSCYSSPPGSVEEQQQYHPQQPQLIYIDDDCFTQQLQSPLTPSTTTDIKPSLIPAPVGGGRRISRGRVNSLTPQTAETAELAALKRHVRMIRNRESASLSRKKKKEYVTNLEGRVKQLEQQVQTLKHENNNLRNRLLQATPQGKKSSFTAGAKVALFSLCFFTAVLTTNNFQQQNHVGQEQGQSSSRVIISATTINSSSSVVTGTGRHHPIVVPKHLNVTRDEFSEFKPKGNSTASANGRSGGCDGADQQNNNFFNVTESRKVQSRLEGLFKVPKKKNSRKKVAPPPLVYSLIAANANSDLTTTTVLNKPSSSTNNNGLTVYGGAAGAGEGGGGVLREILEKLHRREDTFYVVSLNAENHLLLSAKNANESSRPKMTLLMPWRNETSGGVEELMQIDCEVFQVFNLNKQQQPSPPASSSGDTTTGRNSKQQQQRTNSSSSRMRSSRRNSTTSSSRSR